MSDAPDYNESLKWETAPGSGISVGTLLTVEQCEQAVAKIDAERNAIMAQLVRHERGIDERPLGWRLSAQGALSWKKRVRTAINVRAADLKMGDKARAKRAAARPPTAPSVSVPAKPTLEMICAGLAVLRAELGARWWDMNDPKPALIKTFKAMIAAAPKLGGQHVPE